MALSLRFYIDPETGDPHIYNHGVEEQEVEDVIILPNEDRNGREGSRIAIGQTQEGRYIRVVYVRRRDPDHIFVVTAHELRGNALAAFRRRIRRRGK